jgi:succinoglycan biosynthesis protein ExoL
MLPPDEMLRPRVIFLSSCLFHKKFEERYLALRDAGYLITVVGLDWMHGRNSMHPTINDGNFKKIPKPNSTLTRFVLMWPRLFVACWRLRRANQRPDLLFVNSWEMQLFGELFFGGAVRKISDFADVHDLQHSGKAARFINLLERIISNRGWEYVVSSPWFYWNFLKTKIFFNGPCYLIENKIAAQHLPSEAPAPVIFSSEARQMEVTVILWNGILRSNENARFLTRLVSSQKGAFRLRIGGVYKMLDPAVLSAMLGSPYVENFGAYADDQLASLFDGVNYSWVCDLEEDFNTLNLLPNRVYQAMFYGCPSVAIRNTALGKFVNELRLGLVIDRADLSSTATRLKTLDTAKLRKHASRLHPFAVKQGEWQDVISQTAMMLPAEEDLGVFKY